MKAVKYSYRDESGQIWVAHDIEVLSSGMNFNYVKLSEVIEGIDKELESEFWNINAKRFVFLDRQAEIEAIHNYPHLVFTVCHDNLIDVRKRKGYVPTERR